MIGVSDERNRLRRLYREVFGPYGNADKFIDEHPDAEEILITCLVRSKENKKKMANLDQSNYRKFAQDAIKKYNEIGMIADAMVWGRITALYEEEIKKLEEIKACDECHFAPCPKHEALIN